MLIISQLATGSTDGWTYDERKWAIIGTDSDDAVRTAIASRDDCPATISIAGVTTYRPAIEITTEGGVRYATARYEKPSATAFSPHAEIVSIDTTGAMVHLTKSLSTACYPAAGVDPDKMDFNGAIGVTGEGGYETSVAGVDVPVPSMRLAAELTKDKSAVTPGYVGNLMRLYGKTNNAPVTFTIYGQPWSFQAGECRFMGLQTTQVDASHVKLSVTIDVSPNVTGLTIGNITGIEKKGWEYLWVFYEPQDNSVARRVLPTGCAQILWPQAARAQ